MWENRKNKTTFTLTFLKVVRVKVVLFFRFSHFQAIFRTFFENMDFLDFPGQVGRKLIGSAPDFA